MTIHRVKGSIPFQSIEMGLQCLHGATRMELVSVLVHQVAKADESSVFDLVHNDGILLVAPRYTLRATLCQNVKILGSLPCGGIIVQETPPPFGDLPRGVVLEEFDGFGNLFGGESSLGRMSQNVVVLW